MAIRAAITGESRGGHDDLVQHGIEVDRIQSAGHPGRADQAAEQRVRRAGGQPEEPGHQVPQDRPDQPAKITTGLMSVSSTRPPEIVFATSTDRKAPTRFRTTGERDGDLRPQRAGGDRGGHRVGRVVEAVGEVEEHVRLLAPCLPVREVVGQAAARFQVGCRDHDARLLEHLAHGRVDGGLPRLELAAEST